MVNNPDIIYL